jgi:hypothetical protein
MANIDTMIKNNDAQALAAFIRENGLSLDDSNKIVAKTNEVKTYCQKQRDFYDQRQLIKKILLNS